MFPYIALTIITSCAM